MGFRELLILVLILAIVGVVLRGLYMALRSRRGQIRLALDKNVPEYDLEELEFRELPSGGARSVKRSFDRVVEQNRAQNARDREDSRETAIPVLMDAVDEPEAGDRPPDERRAAGQPEPEVESESESREEQESEAPREDPFFDGHGGDSSLESMDSWRSSDASRSEEWDEESLNTHVFVDDDEDGDDDDLDEELDDALDEMLSDGGPSYRQRDDEESERTPEPEHQSEPEPEPEPGPEPAGSADHEQEEPSEDEFARDPVHQQSGEKPIRAGDDDFDILLDDDEERAQRIEELESRQEGASRKLMHWAGEKWTRLGGEAGSLLRKNRNPVGADAADDRSRRSTPPEPDQNELDLDHPHEEAAPPGLEPASSRPEKTGQPREKAGSTPREEKQAASNNNIDPDYSEVLVLNVMARDGAMIQGNDLLPVLLGAGLRFGEMNVFHRHAEPEGGPVLFSVANILNPGTFDLNRLGEFETRGLCFFLTLPNAVDNRQAFERMLETAEKVRDGLGAELKDDNRSVMTRQTIEHYRQRIRDFELRQMRERSGKR